MGWDDAEDSWQNSLTGFAPYMYLGAAESTLEHDDCHAEDVEYVLSNALLSSTGITALEHRISTGGELEVRVAPQGRCSCVEGTELFEASMMR